MCVQALQLLQRLQVWWWQRTARVVPDAPEEGYAVRRWSQVNRCTCTHGDQDMLRLVNCAHVAHSLQPTEINVLFHRTPEVLPNLLDAQAHDEFSI